MSPSRLQPFVAEALRWLPDVDDQDEQPVPAIDPAEVDLPATAPGRVVVADDNADMRDYLRRLLSPRYRVEVVPDGQAALESVLADPPDLVVSDVMMPRLDGMALLARLRSDPRTERVPVLLLSARAGQEAAVEGLAAGADDYLVKPFSARELLARVGAHVQLGRVRREAEERFRAMADLVPALIWVADADGRRIFLNAGWQEFTGSPGGQDVDNAWRARLHPDDEEPYLEVVRAASAVHGPWEFEYRLRRADGAYHWLLERAAPLGGGAEHSGYVGSCTDINARYRESQRQSLLAEVSASLDRAGGIDDQLGTLARVLVSTRLADACDVRRVVDDGRLHRAAVAALDSATESVIATMPEETGDGARGGRDGPDDGQPRQHRRTAHRLPQRRSRTAAPPAGRELEVGGAARGPRAGPGRARARPPPGDARVHRRRPRARRGDRRAGSPGGRQRPAAGRRAGQRPAPHPAPGGHGGAVGRDHAHLGRHDRRAPRRRAPRAGQLRGRLRGRRVAARAHPARAGHRGPHGPVAHHSAGHRPAAHRGGARAPCPVVRGPRGLAGRTP